MLTSLQLPFLLFFMANVFLIEDLLTKSEAKSWIRRDVDPQPWVHKRLSTMQRTVSDLIGPDVDGFPVLVGTESLAHTQHPHARHHRVTRPILNRKNGLQSSLGKFKTISWYKLLVLFLTWFTAVLRSGAENISFGSSEPQIRIVAPAPAP